MKKIRQKCLTALGSVLLVACRAAGAHAQHAKVRNPVVRKGNLGTVLRDSPCKEEMRKHLTMKWRLRNV